MWAEECQRDHSRGPGLASEHPVRREVPTSRECPLKPQGRSVDIPAPFSCEHPAGLAFCHRGGRQIRERRSDVSTLVPGTHRASPGLTAFTSAGQAAGGTTNIVSRTNGPGQPHGAIPGAATGRTRRASDPSGPSRGQISVAAHCTPVVGCTAIIDAYASPGLEIPRAYSRLLGPWVSEASGWIAPHRALEIAGAMYSTFKSHSRAQRSLRNTGGEASALPETGEGQ
jgi:hypothetical protein